VCIKSERHGKKPTNEEAVYVQMPRKAEGEEKEARTKKTITQDITQRDVRMGESSLSRDVCLNKKSL